MLYLYSRIGSVFLGGVPRLNPSRVREVAENAKAGRIGKAEEEALRALSIICQVAIKSKEYGVRKSSIGICRRRE